ncbi:hypothetical protein [Nitrospirillum sp. BR 11163]|uniref:hypothetical protein n=1 Tax=Nitrospirillum sp. BR 11163 TaxID=3104323 RepID=UPI003A4C5483
MRSLPDKVLTVRWAENPYFQPFCAEKVFGHDLPFDRRWMSRRRTRLGEERLAGLLQGQGPGQSAHPPPGLAVRVTRPFPTDAVAKTFRCHC